MANKTITGCITSLDYNTHTGLPSTFDVTNPDTNEKVTIDATSSFVVPAIPPATHGTMPMAPVIEHAQEGCFEVEIEYDDDKDKKAKFAVHFSRRKKNKKCCDG